MSDKRTPNPGSEEAEKLGCTCPVIDNRYGRGRPAKERPEFWISGDCKVHGLEPRS